MTRTAEITREQHYENGRQIVQVSPQLHIDFDVEADGIAGFGSLLSFGGISPYGETIYRELKPTSDIWLPSNRQFCEEHNLERERLMDEGVEPAEAIQDLTDWQQDLITKHGKERSVLVMFNASYDYPIIDLEYKKADLESPFGVAGYCIKSLAMALSKSYDWRQTTKSQLPKIIIPDGEFTHNSLEDSQYQQLLHFGLVSLIQQQLRN